MTLSFTLEWWHVGVSIIALGVLIFATAPKEYTSFMGWPSQDFTVQHAIGVLLLVLGIAYLVLGGIARCFP
jgi:hypothetical protein